MYPHRKQLSLKQLQDPERQKKKYWKKMTLLRKALNDLNQMEDGMLDDIFEVNNLWLMRRRTIGLHPSENKQLSGSIEKSKVERKMIPTQNPNYDT